MSIKSPYATQYTREMMEGKRNPSVDQTNYKAAQKPQRIKIWQQREAAKTS